MVQFVKEQDEFIKAKCVKHFKEMNKETRIYTIDEKRLKYIFELGFKEYQKGILR